MSSQHVNNNILFVRKHLKCYNTFEVIARPPNPNAEPGLTATIVPWKETEQLPLYLHSDKKYSLLRIGEIACVLIETDSLCSASR